MNSGRIHSKISRQDTNVQRERRRWPRLQLRLHVNFSVPQAERKAEGEGTTRDVSAGGAYFFTPNWQVLEEGAKVKLRLTGFSQYNAGPLFRTLEGEGTVVRLEPASEVEHKDYSTGGVAIEFDERPEVDMEQIA